MAKNFGVFGNARRNDQTQMMMIAGALLLVLLGSIGTILALSPGKEPEAAPAVVQETKIDVAKVLIPGKQIEPGTVLEPTLFRVEERPRNLVPARAIGSLEELLGTYARTLIVPDQPLTADYVTKLKPNSAITANIPEGFRAVTIRVDERSSVEGWARPGARVDVVWATVIRGEQTVSTIVYNAKVLSAERQTEGGAQGAQNQNQATPATVTLLVGVDDATKIQLASTAGSLSLSLRGDRDASMPSNTNPITFRELLNQGSDTQAPAAPSEGIVRVRRRDGGFDELELRGGRLVPANKNR